MSADSYTRPDGFLDFGRAEAAKLRAIEERLLAVYRSYGYDEVHVPSLEYRDLYRVERIGEELSHQLLLARSSVPADFPADLPGGHSLDTDEVALGGSPELKMPVHDLVLRPDLTAPIARSFVEGVLRRGPPDSLPYRVAYSGQAWRDLVADGLLLKEHRQTGIECIGPSPKADLEVLLVAIDALRALGVERWTLQIGHAGLTKTLLASVGLGGNVGQTVERLLDRAARLRRMVLIQDDAFFRRYLSKVAGVLLQMYGDAAADFLDVDTNDVAAWRERLPKRYERLLVSLLQERLKLSSKQVDWVLRIARIDPRPKQFFVDLQGLCTSHDSKAACAQLQMLTEQIQTLRKPRLLLTAAAGRGIAYYTGMTFELHSADTGSAYTELGGGGRYDELHRIIHSRARRTAAVRGAGDIPKADPSLFQGVGMCFGLERLAAAVHTELRPARDDVRLQVMGSARAQQAQQAADRLRAVGLRVRSDFFAEGDPAPNVDSTAGAVLLFAGESASQTVLMSRPKPDGTAPKPGQGSGKDQAQKISIEQAIQELCGGSDDA